MLDREVLALARTQHGVVAVAQLTRLGHSRATVSRARARGEIVTVASGVVRIASSPETFRTRCMTLQLQTCAAGFLSGPTAAHLHGLRAMPTDMIRYTAPTTFRHRVPDWARVHLSSWYDPIADRTMTDDGLVIASPMRMLWGLAALFNQHRFDRAAEDAWNLGIIDPPAAAQYLDRHRCRGKDGVRRLEHWLEGALERDRPTQSNLERRLIEALAEVGLPEPCRQYPLTLANGDVIHLDIAWPAVALAVEPGAAAWHAGRLAVRRDQARDRACTEVGWMVVRFDESIADDYRRAAAQVRRIHDERRRTRRNLPQTLR